MGGRRPAGAERVEVPESNTLLPMPRSSLMAAVRDRITGANGLIPSNGFPLGQQLETVKAGHLPPQLTRRGIDQKKCKLLSTRWTPRPWFAGVPANSSNRRGQFSARRIGRPRLQIQPLLQSPIVAPVTNARRQSTREQHTPPNAHNFSLGGCKGSD